MTETESRKEALQQLLQKAERKGYLTIDDIIEIVVMHDLSLPEQDRMVSDLTLRHIEILEEVPGSRIEVQFEEKSEKTTKEKLGEEFESEADVDSELGEESESDQEQGSKSGPISELTQLDFAHCSYDELYRAVIQLCPSLEPLVRELQGIRRPQKGEAERLMVQAAEGNAYARNRIVEMYIRFALRNACIRAEQFDLDLEETFGDAVEGLVAALDHYRPNEGAKFITCANFYIRGSMQRKQSYSRKSFYYPVHAKDIIFYVYRALKLKGCISCEQQDRCHEMKQIIQEKSGKQEAWIFEAFQQDISLDAIPEIDTDERIDSREDPYLWYLSSESVLEEEVENIAERDYLRNRVWEILSYLRQKEQDILIRRFGLDGPLMTLEEIGTQMGVTRERVRQIEEKGLKRFKQFWDMSDQALMIRRMTENNKRNIEPLEQKTTGKMAKSKKGDREKQVGQSVQVFTYKLCTKKRETHVEHVVSFNTEDRKQSENANRQAENQEENQEKVKQGVSNRYSMNRQQMIKPSQETVINHRSLEEKLSDDIVGGIERYAKEAYLAYKQIPDELKTVAFAELQSTDEVINQIKKALPLSVRPNYLSGMLSVSYNHNSVLTKERNNLIFTYAIRVPFEDSEAGNADFRPNRLPNDLVAAVEKLTLGEVYSSVLISAARAHDRGLSLISPNSPQAIVDELRQFGEVELNFAQYPGQIERNRRVQPGKRLKLVREPKNVTDKNAINVQNSAGSLGYLPGNIAEMLSPLIDLDLVTCNAIASRVIPIIDKSTGRKSVSIKILIDYAINHLK